MGWSSSLDRSCDATGHKLYIGAQRIENFGYKHALLSDRDWALKKKNSNERWFLV